MIGNIVLNYEEIPLSKKINLIIREFENRRSYLDHNKELFDIYEGSLLDKVDTILRESLNPSYYQSIKHRIFPINVLKRLIDKLSKAYSNDPIRTASSNDEVLEFYEKAFHVNQKLNSADEFSHMFKGYALEPFVDKGKPQLRVLPYDRFFVISENFVNPLEPTIFVKIMGKLQKQTSDGTKDVQILFCYTDTEFLVITEEGDVVQELMGETEGVNELGEIPFMYGNRSMYEIMPVQDTDMLQNTKIFPVLFTDTAGTSMFQAFSILYTIDIDSENMSMSPNAVWSFVSDRTSEKDAKIGSIKPEADTDKQLNLIKHFFSSWMETKGIKVGSIGDSDGRSNSSGISKIIDEMDTFEQVTKSINSFKSDEFRFWRLMQKMHNNWVNSGQIPNMPLLPENWIVQTEFDKPRPLIDRKEEVDIVSKERDDGYISKETAIKKLYPDWSDDQIKEEMIKIDKEQGLFNG